MSGKLILTHGLPASGKSTWAKNLQKLRPQDIIIAERDEIRTSLLGESYHRGKPDQKSEQKVSNVQKALIEKGLNEGKTVIVSDTNLNPNFLVPMANLGRARGIEVEQKYFDVPLEECKRRNKLRGQSGGREVPEHVLDQMAAKAYGKDGRLKEFRIGERTTFAYDKAGSKGERLVEDFNNKAEEKYGKLKGGTINFDMDGTLADTREISNQFMSGKKKDFHRFHTESEFIKANDDVLKIATAAHKEGIPITVTTARADTYATATINWLNRHNIPVRRLYMRKEGDFRSDYEVKKEILNEARKEGVFFAHCVDDNPAALKAWKENGIRTTDVPFHKAVDPETVIEKYETIVVDNPIGAGICLRCGRAIKKGSIGPKCLTRI